MVKRGARMNHYSIVLDKIKDQIIQKFNPSRIILFGSVAKGIWRNNSDIDLCIIKDTDNKRDLITNMYVEVESEIPFDIVLYTNEEWNRCLGDKTAFAYHINNTGVIIYG